MIVLVFKSIGMERNGGEEGILLLGLTFRWFIVEGGGVDTFDGIMERITWFFRSLLPLYMCFLLYDTGAEQPFIRFRQLDNMLTAIAA